MEILHNYGDVEDVSSDLTENNSSPSEQLFSTSLTLISNEICSAPAVSVKAASHPQLIKKNQIELLNNPKADVVLAPVHGPAHPFKFNVAPQGSKQAGMGQVEKTSIEDWCFDNQFQTFQRSGYAVDMNTNEIIGDYNEYIAQDGETAQTSRAIRSKSKRPRESKTSLDVSDIGNDEDGIWAPLTAEQLNELPEITPIKNEDTHLDKSEDATSTKLTTGDDEDSAADIVDTNKKARMHIIEPDEEAEMWEKVNERKLAYALPPRPTRGSEIPEATSTFHGKSLVDYQGRPWTHPPSDLKPDNGDHDCFIPKKCVRKLTGHTKGVQAIEFYPNTGHLLLSGSLDGKCKIWDMAEDKNVRRTYIGHEEAVRSIHFNNVGSHFLSSGFDRTIRLWDVETGQATGTFSNRKMGYQVRFHPKDNNSFLMAANDNKIYQWDTRSGAVTQEYNYHLAACNTVTFFDDGRKFASTSDDKKILIWEYDIPVPIKYIAEPGMHSVPAVTLHPSLSAFAGQSMDNSIVTYACGEKVKLLRKKVFRGHTNSGYACQIGFSPNGKFLMSGDGLGKLHVWDWKTTKPYRKFQAHDGGPCMAAVWHPIIPSCVATCGWDGLIKIWD